MKPIGAFQYLFDNNLPLTLTFPFEEEKGHVITGKGVCHIDKIHGTSKVTLGRFNPDSLVYHLKRSRSFQASFEIKGETYFCAIEGLTVTKSTMVVGVPSAVTPSMRRLLRIEPSLRLPVILYVYTQQNGTVSFAIQDITEQGISFATDSPIAIGDNFMCGLQIPID
jgi:hypothetical protein